MSGGAEVADHAARDQGLHHGVADLGVAEADLAAAPRVVARRCECELGATRLDLGREQARERERLGAQRRHAARRLGGEHGVDAALERGQRQHRRRAAQVARDAGGRPVVRRELERRAVAAAVVDMREHQQRGACVQACRDLVGLDQHQLAAALARQRLGDVQIGREVVPLGDDHLARRRVGRGDGERGRQHLEQVDARRVGHHQLARARADQARDLVAHALRQLHPAGAVPAADEPLAPFAAHHLRDALGRGARQHAERVAVEVEHAGRDVELRAQRREEVGGIGRPGVVSGHGRAFAVVGFSEGHAARRAPVRRRPWRV